MLTDLHVSKQTHAIIWAHFIIMMTQPGKSGTPSLLENLTPFFCGINGPPTSVVGPVIGHRVTLCTVPWKNSARHDSARAAESLPWQYYFENGDGTYAWSTYVFLD